LAAVFAILREELSEPKEAPAGFAD
jgi:hypothetical protein